MNKNKRYGQFWAIIILTLMFSMGLVSAWSSIGQTFSLDSSNYFETTGSATGTSQHWYFESQDGWSIQPNIGTASNMQDNIHIVSGGGAHPSIVSGTYMAGFMSASCPSAHYIEKTASFNSTTGIMSVNIYPYSYASAKWYIRVNDVNTVNITGALNQWNNINVTLNNNDNIKIYFCGTPTIVENWIDDIKFYDAHLLTNESLSFTGNQNITRYLSIPNSVSVITAGYFNLSGNELNLSNSNNLSEGINNGGGAFYVQVKQHYINDYVTHLTDYVRVDGIGGGQFGGTYTFFYNDSTTSVVTQLALAGTTYQMITKANPNPTKNVTYINVSIKSTGISDIAYEKNLTTYYEYNLINPSVLISNSQVWNYSGQFNQTNNRTTNLASIITQYLNATYLVGSNYLIPFIFHSDTAGVLEYSDLQFNNEGFTENSQTYNATTYETSRETFYLNLTYDPSMNTRGLLNYAGVNYSSSNVIYGNNVIFYANVSIPAINSSVSNDFYWIITTYNGTSAIQETSTVNTQTVNKIYLVQCNSTYNISTLNFTAYGENDSLRLSPYLFAGTFNYWLGDGSTYQNISLINNAGSTAMCMYPSNKTFYSTATIQYEKDGYVKRNYYLYSAILTNVTNNISMYLLATSSATAFIISIKDGSQLPITDAYVYIQRYYPGTGLFQTVAMAKTDGSGNTVAHFEVETEDYRIIVMKDGVVIYTSPVQKIYCSATPCTLPIQTSSAGVDGWQHVGNLTNLVYFGPSYDSVTHMVSYTYIDTSGTTHYGRLFVYTINSGSGKNTICDVNSTSNAATLVCDVSGIEGTVYAEGYISRSPEVLVWAASWVINTIKSIMGMEGLFWALIVIMILAIGGMLMGGITGGILGAILGLIGSAWIGIASFGTITIFGVIILGVVIIWLIKN